MPLKTKRLKPITDSGIDSIFRKEVQSHTEGSEDQDKDIYKTFRYFLR